MDQLAYAVGWSSGVSVCIMIDLWNKVSAELVSFIATTSNVHVGAIEGYVATSGELVLRSEDQSSLSSLEADYADLVRNLARRHGHQGGVRFDVDNKELLRSSGMSFEDAAPISQMSLFGKEEPVVARSADGFDSAAAFQIAAPLNLEDAFESLPNYPQIRTDVCVKERAKAAGLKVDQRLDNWVYGSENIVLFRSAIGMATGVGQVADLLYVVAGGGLGKSHVLNAIGNEALKADPELRVRLWSAEEFTNSFFESLAKKSQAEFRSYSRNVDLFLFDDIDFLQNKPAVQDELASILRELTRSNCRIVLAGNVLPKELALSNDRLKNSINSGLVLHIEQLSHESRVQIVTQQVQRAGLSIEADAARYVAATVQTSVTELIATTKRVIAYGLAAKGPISLELVVEQLPQVYKSSLARPTVARIIDVVSEHFNVSRHDILEGGRTKHIAHARKIAMFLARDMTTRSFPELASDFKKGDHTTIMHAHKTVSAALNAKKPEFVEPIETLRRQFHV